MASGRVQLDRINALQANIAAGEVVIGHIAGRADIDGGVIAMRIGEVEGTVGFSTSGGQAWIGHASADLDLSSSSCDFDIDHADGSVTATTAGGAIRIGRMTHGRAKLIERFRKHRGRHQRGHRCLHGRQQQSRGGAHLRFAGKRRAFGQQGHGPRPHAAQRHHHPTRRKLDPHEASVTSTSSRQLVCVPSRVASANRASPRRRRAAARSWPHPVGNDPAVRARRRSPRAIAPPVRTGRDEAPDPRSRRESGRSRARVPPRTPPARRRRGASRASSRSSAR